MMLFESNDELQMFLPVNQGFTLENMQDDLETAFQTFIAPRVSAEFVQTLLDDNGELHTQLVRLIKRANANLGFMLHFPQVKVQISDSGITYAGRQEDFKQASDRDKEDLYKSITAKGYKALEDILIFLYKNSEEFSEWKSSEQFKDFTSLLINTAKDFRGINGSFLIFLEMIPFIEDVELEIIEPALPMIY
jgi:hypothetical protein